MLETRNISSHFLAENIAQIGSAFRSRLASDQAAFVDVFIRAGVQASLDREQSRPSAAGSEPNPLVSDYLKAILGGDRKGAVDVVLGALQRGLTLMDVYADLLQPAMYTIGGMWERNEITVAQEHMATAITQYVVAVLYPMIKRPDDIRGRIVLTGVEGEHHHLGANMVADALEANGWDVRFLGTDTPVDGVLKVIEEHDAGIVGISATMLFNVPAVVRLIRAVQSMDPRRTRRILLGGSAFRDSPELFKELGADGCALDVRAAVQLTADIA